MRRYRKSHQTILHEVLKQRKTFTSLTSSHSSIDVPYGCEDGQILCAPIDPDILKWTDNHHDHIYVRVNVEASPWFTKVGPDVYSESDVSLSQALLGGELFCPGLGDAVTAVKVEALDSSHRTLVAPGKGIPCSTGRGSHFVEVGVRVPAKLSAADRAKFVAVFKDEEVENGLVDGCCEPEWSHKFRTGAVEPSNVTRNFATAKLSMRQRHQINEEKAKRNPLENMFSSS